MAESQARITSYNVCYTKLLRVASEFRYRHPVVRKNSLIVTLSQSGETADTLAGLREAKRLGYGHSLSICNVPESSLVRESDLVSYNFV